MPECPEEGEEGGQLVTKEEGYGHQRPPPKAARGKEGTPPRTSHLSC